MGIPRIQGRHFTRTLIQTTTRVRTAIVPVTTGHTDPDSVTTGLDSASASGLVLTEDTSETAVLATATMATGISRDDKPVQYGF